MKRLEILSHSPQETQRVGQRLGELAEPGDLYLLTGPLGAGKTTLIQGIAQGLGVQDSVRSPTFVLMACYRGRFPLYHLDLYRLEDLSEALDLGLEEYLEGEGLLVVEWAERAREVFPAHRLHITLEPIGEQERRLLLQAEGERYEALLDRLGPRLAPPPAQEAQA